MAEITIRIEGDSETDPLVKGVVAVASMMGVRATTAARILIKEALDARGRAHADH